MKQKMSPDWEYNPDYREAWENLLSDVLFGMCNQATGDSMDDVVFSDSPRRERAAKRYYGEDKYNAIHEAMFELVEIRRDENATVERD